MQKISKKKKLESSVPTAIKKEVPTVLEGYEGAFQGNALAEMQFISERGTGCKVEDIPAGAVRLEKRSTFVVVTEKELLETLKDNELDFKVAIQCANMGYGGRDDIGKVRLCPPGGCIETEEEKQNSEDYYTIAQDTLLKGISPVFHYPLDAEEIRKNAVRELHEEFGAGAANVVVGEDAFDGPNNRALSNVTFPNREKSLEIARMYGLEYNGDLNYINGIYQTMREYGFLGEVSSLLDVAEKVPVNEETAGCQIHSVESLIECGKYFEDPSAHDSLRVGVSDSMTATLREIKERFIKKFETNYKYPGRPGKQKKRSK